MVESMGIRSEGTPVLKLREPHVVSMQTDQRNGRTVWREAGYMLLENIVPDPEQPRKDFSDESIKLLAESITKIGLLNPITIRWNPELAKHVVVTGERRYRAVKLLGHDSIKCIFEGDEKAPDVRLQEQLIENCVREDLNDVDRANAFARLRDMNGWNVQQLADALCVSKATVSRTLKLLELPDDVQQQVAAGQLASSAAYQIATKAGSDDEKRELAARITSENLSRDETAKLAGAKSRKPEANKAGRPTTKEDYKLPCGVKVTFTFHKKRVSPQDRIQAAEELLAKLKAA